VTGRCPSPVASADDEWWRGTGLDDLQRRGLKRRRVVGGQTGGGDSAPSSCTRVTFWATHGDK